MSLNFLFTSGLAQPFKAGVNERRYFVADVPGSRRHVPGTRNSRKAHQYRNVPGVPGVPGITRTHAQRIVFFTRTHELFPACAQEEHPEHPEQSRCHNGFRCSGYPEQRFTTRNIAMAKPKRESMPLTTAFIDQMREVFGEDDINAAMLAGRQGQATFYLLDKSTGKEIGARLPGTAVEVTAPQVPFEELKAKRKAAR